jgi:hypothetical protein
MANFIITSDNLFKAENVIYENWVEGRQYVVSKMDATDLRGKYHRYRRWFCRYHINQ